MRKTKVAALITSFVLCFIFLFPAAAFAGTELQTLTYAESDKPYVFPLTPDSPDWKQLTTTEEMIKAFQIPEDILKNMSTASLINTLLENPFLTQFFAYDDPLWAFERFTLNYNIYPELLSRPDYLSELVHIYSKSPIPTNKTMIQSDEDDYFRYTYAEILISIELYNSDTPQKRNLIQEISQIYDQKNLVLQKEKGLYSALDGFEWFYTRLENENKKVFSKALETCYNI